MNKGVKVKPSAIHGLGLFAKKKFERGQKILEYKGERLTARQFTSRYPNGFAKYGLMMNGCPRIFIDAKNEQFW